VTGIEKDPVAAERARSRLDRVLEGEASAVLEALAGAGEKFDAFLFADVLEHLEDPVGPLASARRLAAPAATLVASVPNVGHLSLVRDLVLGRFDVLPSGLADAGHLRWFSRSFLEEALEEAGWQTVAIKGLAGAPAPNAQKFLKWAGGFSQVDRESLTTYQWMAVASPK
jgi:2-polyprenyl-3-methyl-5-hydroxy-6-metoxy-1,4-benzoquinol methylase